MPEAHELRRLQEWLRDSITNSRAEGERSPTQFEVERVIRPSSRLSAAARLELYRRSYRLRLLETVRACYPALRHMLGPELFDDFALDYIGTRQSCGCTLRPLADGFSDYLAATRPAGAEAEGWQELIIDLARVERIVADVYEAPGPEGGAVLSSDVLPAQPCARWLSGTITPVTCLRLAQASFPVAQYLSDLRGGKNPPLPQPAHSFLAVCRLRYVVTLTPLAPAGHEFLRRLAAGALIRAAAGAAGLSDAVAWQMVREWADRALLQSIEPQRARRSPGSSPYRYTGRKEPVNP